MSLSDKIITIETQPNVKGHFILLGDFQEAIKQLKENIPNQDIEEYNAQMKLIDKIFGSKLTGKEK